LFHKSKNKVYTNKK